MAKENEMKSVFEELNSIDVNEHTEKKNGLTYLSWAWAWAKVKKLYPGANYTIYERDTQFGPVNYFTDGMTCWVKTGVTIQGLEHIEQLPVMDYKNKSIKLENMTSFDVNKTIQRSLTKALARHGLGLYIYAGEDLPEDAPKQEEPVKKPTQATMNIIGIRIDELKGLGVDVNDESVSKYIAQKNNGKANVNDMSDVEAQHYIKVLEAIISNKIASNSKKGGN